MSINLFKYCAANNKDHFKSYWNGKERIGYKIKTCKNESEIAKAKEKGWTQTRPDKPSKKVSKDAGSDNTESSGVITSENGEGGNTQAGAEGDTAGD